MKGLINGLIVGLTLLVLAAPAPASILILQVPDWNQPNPAAYPADNLPAQQIGVDGYPGWCSPTAGGNLMGYWEDIKGAVGLTDRQAFNLTTAYPGTLGTWEQGLYHDGIVEMGWEMDTGGWRTFASPFPPYRPGGTQLANILQGLLTYAAGSWTDNDYGAGVGSGIVKVAFSNTVGFTENSGTIGLAAMWSSYVNNIDASHPVEVSFSRWVTNDLNADVTVNGQTVHKYGWDVPSSEGHSVVGVGYLDLTPQVYNGDEWFIVQDGWQSTPQYVAVPVDAIWQQNDYITAVPEPSSTVLLVMGVVAAMFLKHRVRGLLMAGMESKRVGC